MRINDARASRLHARITTERDEATGETRYSLTDLDSTNGTMLNGRPVTRAFLADGDKFEVGDQLIRFEMLDEIDREFQRQIHRLLVHDELTGLLTGKSFFSELRREAARAEAESMPFCVLMMDIDFFKGVNDTWSAVKHWKRLAQSSKHPCAPATLARGLAVKNSPLSCWTPTTRRV